MVEMVETVAMVMWWILSISTQLSFPPFRMRFMMLRFEVKNQLSRLLWGSRVLGASYVCQLDTCGWSQQPRLRPSSCYCFCCWGWAQKLVCRRAVAVRLSPTVVWWQQEPPALRLQQLHFCGLVCQSTTPTKLCEELICGWIPFCLKSWVTIACSQLD